jgi:hypothetical protein
MNTERIIKVKNIQCHCYDGTQCEMAIYAKSDSRPGYRWYVGYGADYLPAAKADLDNMRDYDHQSAELADVLSNNRYVGETVCKYRRGTTL